jgi:hypothetical protein
MPAITNSIDSTSTGVGFLSAKVFPRLKLRHCFREDARQMHAHPLI